MLAAKKISSSAAQVSRRIADHSNPDRVKIELFDSGTRAIGVAAASAPL